MSPDTNRTDDSDWEAVIRACEEAQCVAFLAVDLPALDALWADDYAVNSPMQTVVAKPALLELLRAGRIRHEAYSFEIEQLSRHGEVVIVMGHDRVVDPPDRIATKRRYTNVWIRQRDRWRSLARHAHVISREPADR